MRATDWYPDPQVRLFDRTRARWEGVHVHESVRVRGKVGRLRSDMEHHPYSDIADHMKKIDRYTTLWAQQAFEAGRRTSIPEMAGNGLWTFLRNYVLKQGFILGSAGFTISVLNSYYTYTKLAKLQELARTRARSLRVLHVDTARSWRGGQNQVLLTSLGMAERGPRGDPGLPGGGRASDPGRGRGYRARARPAFRATSDPSESSASRAPSARPVPT